MCINNVKLVQQLNNIPEAFSCDVSRGKNVETFLYQLEQEFFPV